MDELAKVIGKAMPNDLTQPEIDKIATAVRAHLFSDEAVERAASGARSYLMGHTGFTTDEGGGLVAAYYGGNWITLRSDQIARAALSAAIGEDIGGGRG